MSAAFALEPLGPPAPCGFPRCTLNAYHDGDHHLKPIERPINKPIYTCRECGARFVIYGEIVEIERTSCGSQECILARARREVPEIPVLCRCRQRSYAHELGIHCAIRFESNGIVRWPWSLRFAPEMTA
jgi:hypothetical protein